MKFDHQKYNLPGLLLAVSQGNQKIEYIVSGFQDVEKKRPFDPNSSFRIGQIAQVFTAAILLRLVDDGALDLDTSIEFVTRGQCQDDGLLRLLVNQYPFLKPVTVRELIMNTSGLPAFDKTITFSNTFLQKPRKRWQLENYFDSISGVDVRYQWGYRVGRRGHYSDSVTNTIVAGLVVEAVQGIGISQVMQGLFRDFNLTDTRYLPYGILEDAALSEVIHGYLPASHPYAAAFAQQKTLTYNSNRELVVYDVTNSYTSSGMGNTPVISSAKDLIYWLRQLMAGQVVVGNYDELFKSVEVSLSAARVDDQYCAGFYKTEHQKFGDIVWLAGNAMGYGVLLAHRLESDKTLLLLANASRHFFCLHSEGIVADALMYAF